MPVEYPSLAELRLRELLDPVTAGVGDVDVALGVDRDAAGIAEPAVAVGGAPQLRRIRPRLVNFSIRLFAVSVT